MSFWKLFGKSKERLHKNPSRQLSPDLADVIATWEQGVKESPGYGGPQDLESLAKAFRLQRDINMEITG
jgi:hypothetical protein